jgi:hypothetical protein
MVAGLRLEARCDRGAAIAQRLIPYRRELPKRGFGSMKGKMWLDESFLEPLPDEELKLWEGE